MAAIGSFIRLVAAGAEQVAEPVTTPWGDRNARVQAPHGVQLTLFASEERGASSS